MTLSRGELPALEMLEGVVLLFSGALLLTPGFVTDAAGFAVLVPPLRRALIMRFIRKSNVRFEQFRGDASGPGSRHHTIEGEYRRDDD